MAKKVFVGMSGGVDSSVTAALMVDAGYDVTGVYMKNWSENLPGMRCPWADDLSDAKRVAVKLGIDLVVYDFEKEYKKKVVDYMIGEFKKGRTPNPDIMCNQEIKFKLFFDTAMENGADFIATGHYAATKKGQLLRAVDDKKDQTYFLYRVTEKALEKTLFPLGGMEKTEVRKIAEQKNLITAHKKDSVGICFVGQVGIEQFLSQYINFESGDVIDLESGQKLGIHKGTPFYTIGQRHGLDLGGGLPYYVVKKDNNKNIVYVSRNINQGNLWTKELTLENIHWINYEPNFEKQYQIRVRHLAPLISAKLEKTEDGLKIILEKEIKSIASGQSIVIYDDLFCLGGGIIK